VSTIPATNCHQYQQHGDQIVAIVVVTGKTSTVIKISEKVSEKTGKNYAVILGIMYVVGREDDGMGVILCKCDSGAIFLCFYKKESTSTHKDVMSYSLLRFSWCRVFMHRSFCPLKEPIIREY
jgi:hypothetical protein